MRSQALFFRVALLSFLLGGWLTPRTFAICPPSCGLAYSVDSTGDGHNVGPVTQCNDGTGHCTLRAAIEAANAHAGDDGIFFNIPTTDPGYNTTTGVFTITLNSALPDLSANLTIQGPGAGKLNVHANANNSNQFRVFNVTTASTVSFSDITISGGVFLSGGSGAGIQNTNTATVNITNCVLANNFSLGGGGAISINSGIVNVSRSTFNNNGTTGGGSAIANGGGTLNATDCTFTANSSGGGGALGAISNNIGNTTITNCTFSGNSSGRGGALVSFGVGTVTVNNSTFTGNSATLGGGGAIASLDGTTNLNNCTITGNMVANSPNGGAGGVSNLGAGKINVRSTIVALNTATGFSVFQDVSGAFVSQGFNLIGRTNGSTGFPASTDQTGSDAAPLDPKIDPNGLQDNGGPTRTVALLVGSPAIDKGTRAGLPGSLTTDQRGTGFPRIFDNPNVANAADGSDIGAFEVQTAPGLVANVSTRLPVGTGDNVLIEGFTVQGPSGSIKKIIVRAIGPSLAAFGITDALANPALEIHDANNNNAIVATNNDWKVTQPGGLITANQSAEISASGFAPGNDLESAIIANLPPGSYTAVVRGVGNTVGTAVVDAYDLSNTSSASLVNVATRGLIQPADGLMIGGFITQTGLVKAVVRAIGPSLAGFGIANALPDTTLQLRDANGALVVENDDWKIRSSDGGSQQAEIEATGLQPSDDREAAVVTTLPPGQYTAQVRGKPETTGTGVVQVYFLP
jgi:CSLREA domain-containing protein